MPPSSIGPRSEADRLRDERAADARLFRRNLVAAAFVFGVALLVYAAFSLRSFALPGEPAEALAGFSGVRPNLMERYLVWRGAVSAVLALAPSSCLVAAANLFHAVVSAYFTNSPLSMSTAPSSAASPASCILSMNPTLCARCILCFESSG